MQAPPTNHITTTMQPRPSHGGFPGKPRTLSLFPLLLSPAKNTYPAIPMPLGPINQIAITTTTGPRPTHEGYSPLAMHQHANHPQTNSSAYPLALKRGQEGEGGAHPPRPPLLPATHPPVLKPLNLYSSLYSTPLPDTKTTLPLLIIGDCHLVRQHPLSLPTRGFFATTVVST